MATLETQVREALSATANQSDEVRLAAIKAMIQQPDRKTANVLWIVFVAGLTLGMLAALAGILAAVMDGNQMTSADVLVTAFSSILTGLIGLFVKSPVQAGNN